jgi:hypothetical protein
MDSNYTPAMNELTGGCAAGKSRFVCIYLGRLEASSVGVWWRSLLVEALFFCLIVLCVLKSSSIAAAVR